MTAKSRAGKKKSKKRIPPPEKVSTAINSDCQSSDPDFYSVKFHIWPFSLALLVTTIFYLCVFFLIR